MTRFELKRELLFEMASGSHRNGARHVQYVEKIIDYLVDKGLVVLEEPVEIPEEIFGTL